MSSGPPSSSYEQVREALRERGYLETPLERWFLGRFGDPFGHDPRRRLTSALLAGVLAGPLLGLLLAAVLVVESRGLIRVWPDGVLYALLFAPVLGALVALAEALVGFAIRAGGRVPMRLSPRKASITAGLVVSGALALYLGFWWVRAGGRVTLVDVAALLALALGAGFAGRVISAAALVQAALRAGRAPQRRRPRMGALLLAAAAVVAIVAALAGAAFTARNGNGAPVTVQDDAPRRVVLVAWDGLSWELERGLRRVNGAVARVWPGVSGEVVAPLLAAPGVDPAATWTTVATGTPPSIHGVGSLEFTTLAGAVAPAPRYGVAAGPLGLLMNLWPTQRRPARAGVRQVPAFWEVIADARKTAVVGWWATWPATSPGRAGGYLVSDGALAALRRGRGVGEAIFPADWGASRGASWLAEAERLAGAAATGGADAAAREALVTDLFALEALKSALADPDVAAATVYLPGLDILRERSRQEGRDPFETLDLIAAHHRAVTTRLASMTELSPTTATAVFVVGLPGRASAGERGFLLACGGALRGTSAPIASLAPLPLTAIAPTLVAAAGCTVDDRMSGPVAEWALRAGATVERRRTRVTPAVSAAPARELEQDVTERLRSLGYVK